MKKAIYALSADPITYGHMNIIERILSLFDHVVVAIGINPEKKYTFSLEEREALARRVLLKHGDRVSVRSFPGLLSDFAYENGISTIVRGARNSTDFDFERLINDINQSFRQGLETIIFMSDQNKSHISSSAVKELVKNQAKNLLDYVPLIVKRSLERRVRNLYLIGITGEIACGKSYVGKALCDYHKRYVRGEYSDPFDPRIAALPRYTNIDLDEIGHEILEKANEKIYSDTRQLLAGEFGRDILDEAGYVKTPILSSRIFKNKEYLDKFNSIMKEPMSLLLRRKLLSLSGVVFINSALIAEAEMGDIVNNEVIVVQSSRDKRYQRLLSRGYCEEVIAERLAAQYVTTTKVVQLKMNADLYGYGTIIPYQNDQDNCLEDIKYLYEEIQRRIIKNDN